MRSLVRLLVASLPLFWLSIPAVGQPPGGLGTFIVASCGTLPTAYTAGQFNRAIVMDVNGNLCSSVSVSASVTGFPGASPTTGTPISVTASAGGVTGTLPAGTVVVASNVGTTNIAYCKLGATSTTSDQPIAPNGGWFAFTVGAATQLTCITSTSTTTVNMVGGAGLPTGTGGGGGGSGGGAVTIADGADVTQGALADAACATDNGSCTVAALVKRNNQRLTTVIAGIPVTNAGTFATQSAVTAASGSYSSGAFASGSFASGSHASGSFASGAFASGSVASGAIAAGAQVDLLTMRGTKNAGTAAANSLQVGGVFNSTPLTLTDTQQSSAQLDANGYLKVNVAAGGAAGGTSSNFGSSFPTPGTAIGFSDGTNMVAAKVGAVANVAAATNMMNTLAIAQYNATPLTVTDTRYQSLQSDVNGFLKVNVSNANTNGQATMANSSPVVIASNQSAVPVSVASGGIASGAVASGAYASGAVASGAYASGSLASGAVVDITNMSAATGAAPPSKAIYLGANTSGATAGLVQGLIQCDSTAIYDASTSGSTELVALTSGRTIYVCGYTILAAGTVNVKLIYGTGTACATGSNNMTPAYQLTTQVGLVDGSPFSRGLKTASANALCINTSAGIAAQAIVYYAKL